MLSKIGDTIKPLLSKGDIVQHPDPHKQDREGGSKKPHKDDEPAERDDTLFSVEAIRALLQQENGDGLETAFADLDLLQRHGIANIPIRLGQSIPAAIATAADPLRGK